MEILIFTKNETRLKNLFPKNTQFHSLAQVSNLPASGIDLFYIDVSTLSPADVKKTLTKIKKSLNNSDWGIIDPKGSIKDPACFFFDGASDYIGPALLKSVEKIEIKRIKQAISWRKEMAPEVKTKNSETKPASNVINKNGIKFPPANIFPGWKNISSGKTMPFFLLYCSLQGDASLETRFDKNAHSQIQKRFVNTLNRYFENSEAIKWMDSGKDCLYLIPPKAKCVETIIEACIRMTINAPMITIETLGVTVPVNFVFTLHYGQLSYKAPGKTGTVVSDAVNAVFHMGSKKAEAGRVTVSGEIPDGSIPKSLEDCFVYAGTYEGRKIWHTKKFSYEKAWK
ncbi:MAG: hypothetical protein FWC97_09025 [Treponema sp.]|nr:hypothetical protein [Treponema sp.]